MSTLRLATGRLKSGAVSPLSDGDDPHATAMLARSSATNAIGKRLAEKPRRMRSTGLSMRIYRPARASSTSSPETWCL